MITERELTEELLFESVASVRQKLETMRRMGRIRNYQVLGEGSAPSATVVLLDGREVTIGQV